MIKIFKFNEYPITEIEDIINAWEKDNKFKIDSISICPNKWYLNNKCTAVSDMELILIINYHKRKIRKIKEENNGTK